MKVRYKGRSDPLAFINGQVYEVRGTWKEYYYIEAGDGEECMVDKEFFDVVDDDAPGEVKMKARYVGKTDPKELIHGKVYDVLAITTFYYVKTENGDISMFYEDEFENVEEEKEK